MSGPVITEAGKLVLALYDRVEKAEAELAQARKITDEMVCRAHAAGPVEYATEFDESFTRKMLEAALKGEPK